MRLHELLSSVLSNSNVFKPNWPKKSDGPRCVVVIIPKFASVGTECGCHRTAATCKILFSDIRQYAWDATNLYLYMFFPWKLCTSATNQFVFG
jgi:hypothetical protein